MDTLVGPENIQADYHWEITRPRFVSVLPAYGNTVSQIINTRKFLNSSLGSGTLAPRVSTLFTSIGHTKIVRWSHLFQSLLESFSLWPRMRLENSWQMIRLDCWYMIILDCCTDSLILFFFDKFSTFDIKRACSFRT